SYYCSNTANTFNMHNANALWTAGMVDDMDLTDEQRARHEQHRAIHYGNMLNGKIYSQPFSEGGGAAAGKHPFGTTARRTEGGWIINGKKIFASLAGSADYYGVLCTGTFPTPPTPTPCSWRFRPTPKACRLLVIGTLLACVAPSPALCCSRTYSYRRQPK